MTFPFILGSHCQICVTPVAALAETTARLPGTFARICRFKDRSSREKEKVWSGTEQPTTRGRHAPTENPREKL